MGGAEGGLTPERETTFNASPWRASVPLEEMVARVRATPNRGDVHVFLGHPMADLCDTTTVEPGNAYSPGVWTCGIGIWAIVDGEITTPAELPADALAWGFGADGGTPPVLTSAWSAGGVRIHHRLAHLGSEGARGVDFNEVTATAETAQEVTLCIAVTEVGPAGGEVHRWGWEADDQRLSLDSGLVLTVERPTVGCHIAAEDSAAPVALLWAHATVGGGTPLELAFKTEHGFRDRPFGELVPDQAVYRRFFVAEGFDAAIDAWATALPARVVAPDPRIAQVWEASAYHIMAAMELGLPRIGAVNYPLFWIRDGVIVLRALDLMGRHDRARTGADYLAPRIFSGGFGAEADAPGEGIWALVNHAAITGDIEWLAGVFPNIRQRVEWLQRMQAAAEPLRAMTENRLPRALTTPAGTVVCVAARDGCIHGRMDWHTPDFYINAWAVAGLRKAAWAARRLGQTEDGAAWSAEADLLEAAMDRLLLPAYGNARDPAVTPYPTDALARAAYRDGLRARFVDWYRTHRLDEDGSRTREPFWTYFEAAQSHNALLLGLKREAWLTLDGLLDDATRPWRVAAWVEGAPGGAEALPFGWAAEARGWLDPDRAWGANMPHNWTSAEMVALLRDIFVREDGDRLALGAGVPPHWLQPGARFGVRDLPTDRGVCAYTVEVDADGEAHLTYEGLEPYVCRWPGAEAVEA